MIRGPSTTVCFNSILFFLFVSNDCIFFAVWDFGELTRFEIENDWSSDEEQERNATLTGDGKSLLQNANDLDRRDTISSKLIDPNLMAGIILLTKLRACVSSDFLSAHTVITNRPSHRYIRTTVVFDE